MQTLQTDVLVVGGGAAGARAALEARLAGARVLLAVKGRFSAIGVRGAGASACGMDASGGALYDPTAANPPTPEQLYDDIIQLGLGLADPKLARVLAEDGVRNRSEFTAYNVAMNRGFGYGINAHGVPLMAALAGHIRSRGVDVCDNTMITRLLMRDGECVGALGINETNGEPLAIEATAVILATGGDGQLYVHNFNPSCVTGDGYALGYRAGAEFMNMEFKQVFVGSVRPTRNILHLWLWKQLPAFVNAQHEPFLERYLPDQVTVETVLQEHSRHDPASTRDESSRFLELGIISEVARGGGTPNWGVWIDLRGAEHTLASYIADWLHYRGIFSDEDLIEASVFHQCSNGGMRVDEHAQTSVPGLYAVGECMSGCHGADRLGGNMLGATQVFGARAGRHAARSAPALSRTVAEVDQTACQQFVDHLARLKSCTGQQRPGRLKLALQQSNWRDLLFVRSGAGLRRALAEVERIRQAASDDLLVQSPAEMVEALELENMLVATGIVAQSALARTESRGAHYRVDFPTRNDAEWLKSVIVRQVNGEMSVTTRALDPEWHDRSGDMGKGRWG